MKEDGPEPEYRCRVVSQQFKADSWDDFRLGAILYSPRVPLEEADALLVLYNPSDELLRFTGPKLWLRLNLPGITISTPIQLARDFSKTSILPSVLFTGIRMRSIAFRILRTAAHYRGHE